jgi:hypothetical protein
MPPESEGSPKQRRYPRVRTDVSVRVVTDALTVISARSHEISGGGMSLFIPLELDHGKELTLAFHLPYSRLHFELSAVVKHRSGFCYGVEFMKTLVHQAEELERVVTILSLI